MVTVYKQSKDEDWWDQMCKKHKTKNLWRKRKNNKKVANKDATSKNKR